MCKQRSGGVRCSWKGVEGGCQAIWALGSWPKMVSGLALFLS